MHSAVIMLQLMLLFPTLPLLVMSRRTSRAHRSRHQTLVAAASLLGVLSVLLGLTSVSLAFFDPEAADPLVFFVPPVMTLVACVAVIRRGLQSAGRRRSTR
jgi:hypothetical protein